jgi:peroxiredoxin Q/BCP
MAKQGDRAPDFSLPSTEGDVRLSELLQQGRVLVAFYTEDATPSCSNEIAALKDAADVLDGVSIVGISADSVESHRAFAERLGGVPFALASDADLAAARAYDVVSEDDARRSRRALFVVEQDGTISFAADPFSVNSTAQLEEALRALGVEL